MGAINSFISVMLISFKLMLPAAFAENIVLFPR
jgi:hypothetical protein